MADNAESAIQKSLKDLPEYMTVTRELLEALDDAAIGDQIPMNDVGPAVFAAVFSLESELRRVFRILNITDEINPNLGPGEFDPKTGLFNPDAE